MRLAATLSRPFATAWHEGSAYLKPKNRPPAGRQGSRGGALLGDAVRLQSLLPVLLLVAAAVAGCASTDPSGPPGGPLEERLTAAPLSLPWDVDEQIDWWEDV